MNFTRLFSRAASSLAPPLLSRRLFSRAAFLFVVLAGCLLSTRPAAATNAVVGNGTPGGI